MPDFEAMRSKLPFDTVETSISGVLALPTWRDDFDPSTADPDELARHGLLMRRPIETDLPEVSAAWNDVFSRRWRSEDRVVPNLVQTDHVMVGGLNTLGDRTQCWAGAACPLRFGGFTGVQAAWTVPTVNQQTEQQQGTEGDWSALWIGLDGFSVSPVECNDILAVGVAQRVSAEGQATYQAWYEWFYKYEEPSGPVADLGGEGGGSRGGGGGGIGSGPDPYLPPPGAVLIDPSQFPVGTGDVIFASVNYLTTTYEDGVGDVWEDLWGVINLANGSNGAHFGITLRQPTPASAGGFSAEWIMSLPDGGFPATSLPIFTPVVFSFALACMAAPPPDNIVGPVNGQIVNIVQHEFPLTIVSEPRPPWPWSVLQIRSSWLS